MSTTPTHKQLYWTIDVGDGDIGATKRAQIAKAAIMLQHCPVVIHSSSAGGYGRTEDPEIALTVEADCEDIGLLGIEVENALTREGLTDAKVTLEKSLVSWFKFTEAQVEAIERASKFDVPRARHAADHLVQLPTIRVKSHHQVPLITNLATQLSGLLPKFGAPDPRLQGHDTDTGHGIRPGAETTVEPSGETNASNIPGNETNPMMLIDEDLYNRLKNARDDSVQSEIKALKDGLVELSNATKSNSAVLIMVASGLIAVGPTMVKAYAAVKTAASLSLLISGLIASAGGIFAVVGWVAAIAAVFLAIFIFTKDAVNTLVLVNGLTSKVKLTKDWVENGERYKVAVKIPAAQTSSSEKPAAYGCGTYIYWKTRWWGQPVGFYGSNMGLAFKAADNTEFAVGMDCPNTALGGTNSIRVKSGSDAKGAAKLASDSGNSSDSITVGGHNCVASRASKWGSINYGICWIG